MLLGSKGGMAKPRQQGLKDLMETKSLLHNQEYIEENVK